MSSRVQRTALWLVVASVVPYTTLKLLWLSGSTVGLESSAAVAELHSTRMVVGNVVTILLELVAVGLAVALVLPWGRRVPAWVVVPLAGAATGLLAPLLLGLTVGSALQVALTGTLRTAGMDDMSGWVFALTYGGFGLMALGIATLGWFYVRDRWGDVVSGPPRSPGVGVSVLGAVGLWPFGLLMLAWGLLGPGEAGPAGMDTLAQRAVLVVSGLLALAGWVVPAAGAAARRPAVGWLVTWVGCSTAALQCLVQVLLASGGDPPPATVLLAVVTLPGSAAFGMLVLRQRTTGLSPSGTSIGRLAQDG